MENRTYEADIIRSGRRTVSVEIRPGGRLLVRAPYRMSQQAIRAFLETKRPWIERHLRQAAAREQAEREPPFSPEKIEQMMARAREVLPARAAYFAPLVGVSYGRVAVRRQKTRWGSCSAKGTLSFNCLLAAVPERVRDYVVVHELCHRLVMDHSPRFWAQVERVAPDWRESRRWLRREGRALMERMYPPT